MNPFIYPKTIHRRKFQPAQYGTYQPYKPILKKEFSSQCVYCRLPDGLKGYEAFGVDHYRPKSKQPTLKAVYSNLYYACNTCNRRKGSFWPTPEQESEGWFIPNPCDHTMFRHLQYKSARVEAKTQAGKCADEKLDLNGPTDVEYRGFVLRLIDKLVHEKELVESALKKAEAKVLSNPSNAEYLALRNEAQELLVKVNSDFNRIYVCPDPA